MIPVDQTIFGDGENGRPVGNCWQACVASLLDLPLDKVPHFALECPNLWFMSTRLFVIEHSGFDLGCYIPDFPITFPGGCVIGTGRSPRGNFNHAVILDGVCGEMIHDPHPSRDGLADHVIEVFGFTELPLGRPHPSVRPIPEILNCRSQTIHSL